MSIRDGIRHDQEPIDQQELLRQLLDIQRDLEHTQAAVLRGADQDSIKEIRQQMRREEELEKLDVREWAKAQRSAGSWVPDPAGIVDARELVIRQPDWLVADYIERGTVGLLIGPYGSAKSFIALDWSCCVATGLAWQGHRTQTANVMYVAAEGGLGLGKRRMAWEQQHRELAAA